MIDTTPPYVAHAIPNLTHPYFIIVTLDAPTLYPDASISPAPYPKRPAASTRSQLSPNASSQRIAPAMCHIIITLSSAIRPCIHITTNRPCNLAHRLTPTPRSQHFCHLGVTQKIRQLSNTLAQGNCNNRQTTFQPSRPSHCSYRMGPATSPYLPSPYSLPPICVSRPFQARRRKRRR